jgi:hypothetical protein
MLDSEQKSDSSEHSPSVFKERAQLGRRRDGCRLEIRSDWKLHVANLHAVNMELQSKLKLLPRLDGRAQRFPDWPKAAAPRLESLAGPGNCAQEP